MDWKAQRDALLKVLIDSVDGERPDAETMMLFAKLTVKLKSMQTEKEFAAFDARCEQVMMELQKQASLELLKRLAD